LATTIPEPFAPGAYAQDEDEATIRFNDWKHRDPFPEIPPALLNTADLLDYIRVTAMISPFRPTLAEREKLLKPASCAIEMGGEYLYWEEARDVIYGGARIAELHETLQPGDEVVLKRNAIVYVSLAPTFRIPNYIAARFNLTIQNVYRGLLVGTGPLVDPGFSGHLYLPLHNLTSNDYRMVVGEPIVWMEFTKLSVNEAWCEDFRRPQSQTGQHRVGQYVPFPRPKRARRRLYDYTRSASDGPIRSSIPLLFAEAQRAAESARDDARRTARFLTAGAIIGVIALIALAFQIEGTVRDTTDRQDDLRVELSTIQKQLAASNATTAQQAARIATLERALRARSPR
jgi:deoxycytidine triphosphate deaminase